MGRFLAFLVLCIPTIAAAAGIKLMRDTLFSHLIAPIPWLWLQFIVGLVLFALGFSFFAGFLLHRDRKSGKVAPRFQKNIQQKEMQDET
ncbi:DUF2627 domain-containing protein [Caryophanon latum]|uniref:DUF2627 domain-containing protein n=1 Tax=Caryophanon latum TaxID=33977 RepID=A0A1C0YUU3_9BACL|nr:DUF2627 domain-containing protein [Caryophanon latum]OCS90894.1 hypothetical protein A6K76_02245 [Caryophanon latum]